jgi:hypothetical protein
MRTNHITSSTIHFKKQTTLDVAHGSPTLPPSPLIWLQATVVASASPPLAPLARGPWGTRLSRPANSVGVCIFGEAPYPQK